MKRGNGIRKKRIAKRCGKERRMSRVQNRVP
jgi:hypothetical protein